MRALSSADWLSLWELGQRLHPLDRGLLVLSAAHPDTGHERLADWPLGRRNAALTELWCACFGRSLRGQVSCPHCAETLEFQMDGQALLSSDTNPIERVLVKGHTFRLPTTRDLAQAARETDLRQAAIRLLEICRTDAADRLEWRDEDLEEIGEKLASADPMSEIRLTLNCARCSEQWQEVLDMAAFLWKEIDARARRLLMEVHTLAAAYGWTERESLSLSEPRRRFYLEMVRQ
jgi:hypothetical protein